MTWCSLSWFFSEQCIHCKWRQKGSKMLRLFLLEISPGVGMSLLRFLCLPWYFDGKLGRGESVSFNPRLFPRLVCMILYNSHWIFQNSNQFLRRPQHDLGHVLLDILLMPPGHGLWMSRESPPADANLFPRCPCAPGSPASRPFPLIQQEKEGVEEE